jgi:hypothetical protein
MVLYLVIFAHNARVGFSVQLSIDLAVSGALYHGRFLGLFSLTGANL